ncbi:hypothetical protein KZ829_27215 [Actinoplanes hulinensis]|uniref:Uncharacterized protein n=1 Tax=Actinoplanes hulinensis TaxID=1144547 RepID=A0ABS7B8R0_9ACTN|nr:hypothetical protein [Actinoplanes hulinensis]MBW6437428.1 hypothetical protein [Actinoplanes hulinensis]
MNDSRGRSLAWLGHPVSMAALVLLAVNDHVWKAAHPGWVTGKLSDVAGMVVAPPLLAAVAGLIAPRAGFRWVAPGAILTVGVGFAMVKTMGYAAALASGAWSLVTPSLVRVDPSDLLALPFLGVAWWVARREPRSAPQWLKALRLAVFLPLALAGVAATSATPTPDAHSVVVDPDGALYLGADTLRDGEPWVVSRDGGRTFVASAGPRAAQAPQCSRSEPVVCYQPVHRRIAVESRVEGGPWQMSWEISAEDVAHLSDAYPHRDSYRLSSVELAVLDVPGGHVVAVANGRDGFAVRDVSGSWQRIGFPTATRDIAPVGLDEARATGDAEENAPFALAFSLFLGGLVLTLVAVRRARRAGARAGLYWLMAPLATASCCAVPVGLIATTGDSPLQGVSAVTWIPLVAVVVICPVVALKAGRLSLAGGLGAALLVTCALGTAYAVWIGLGTGHVGHLALLLGAAAALVTPAAAKVV